MNQYKGTCHCGNNLIILSSEKKPEEFVPRTDKKICSFCQTNDGVWISDPEGSLDICHAHSTKEYRFGSKEVGFYFCVDCGTLCFALFQKKYAVARVACFHDIFEHCQHSIPTDFSLETKEEGEKRRKNNWTPVFP